MSLKGKIAVVTSAYAPGGTGWADVEEALTREIPLGRVGLPRDSADAMLRLSSPCYVTGLNLPVNGGNQLTRMARLDALPVGFDTYDAHRAA